MLSSRRFILATMTSVKEKKVEGIQSYLDGAIQEANPLNYDKIYQYDAYLKLVNSLNGSLGDSDF